MSFPAAGIDSPSDAAFAFCFLLRVRRNCVRVPRAGACARRARARAEAPPAGSVAPPPSLRARPPRWPRGLPPLLRGFFAFCGLPFWRSTGPRAPDARLRLNHATNEADAQVVTSTRGRRAKTLTPPRCAARHAPHPPLLHPPHRPLVSSNSLAREYQARAARVVVRGFHMLIAAGSVPSAGSVSHHTGGLRTSDSLGDPSRQLWAGPAFCSTVPVL